MISGSGPSFCLEVILILFFVCSVWFLVFYRLIRFSLQFGRRNFSVVYLNGQITVAFHKKLNIYFFRGRPERGFLVDSEF